MKVDSDRLYPCAKDSSSSDEVVASADMFGRFRKVKAAYLATEKARQRQTEIDRI